MRGKQVSKIFINYRRGDSAGHTGHLCADLMRHFGAGRIFMDIHTVEPGEDFVQTIKIALDSCSVFVAVIGKDWLELSDGGSRRLDNPNDYVRLEIATALNRGIRLIPVLVDGASVPREDGLPSELQDLSRHNAFEISDKRWAYDVHQLIKAIERALKQQPSLHRGLEFHAFMNNFLGKIKSTQAKRFMVGSVGIVVLFIVAIVLWVWTRSIPPNNSDGPPTPTSSPVLTTEASPPVAKPTIAKINVKQDRPTERASSTPIATPFSTQRGQDRDPWPWIAAKARSLYPDGTRIETVRKVGDPQCNNAVCQQKVNVVLTDSSNQRRYEPVMVTYEDANAGWKGTAKRLN